MGRLSLYVLNLNLHISQWSLFEVVNHCSIHETCTRATVPVQSQGDIRFSGRSPTIYQYYHYKSISLIIIFYPRDILDSPSWHIRQTGPPLDVLLKGEEDRLRLYGLLRLSLGDFRSMITSTGPVFFLVWPPNWINK
jgi:hypothetical protein